MTCRTRVHHVVFTHAYPALERFAAYHFLATHPLRHHPMWLDEADFDSVGRQARACGVAHPLQLDMHAHHPVLSPYAQARRRRRHKATDDNNTTAAATMTTPPRVRTRAGDTEEGDMGSVAVLPLLLPPHTSPWHRQQYSVPICQAMVYRHLYMYNMEQMYACDYAIHDDDGNKDHVDQAATAHDDDDDDDDAMADDMDAGSGGRSAPSAARGGKRRNAAGAQFTQYDAYTSHVQRRVRALRQRYQGEQPLVPRNARTRLPYSYIVSSALHDLAEQHKYTSMWWATRAQWLRCNAQPQRGEKPHCVVMQMKTKLVHVSLLARAEEVLRRSVVFAQSGKLIYCFDDACTQLDDDAGTHTSSSSAARWRRGRPSRGEDNNNNNDNNGNDAAAVPDAEDEGNDDGDDVFGASLSHCSVGDNIDGGGDDGRTGASFAGASLCGTKRMSYMCLLLLRDMREHDYAVPLYFSSKQLAHFGLQLRSDAVPVRIPHSTRYVLPAAVQFIDNSNDDGNVSTLQQQQQQQHWRTTTTMVPRRCYYYHLSHIRFPDSMTLTTNVLVAELQHPGVPLHGVTGKPLKHAELRTDQLINVAPQLASLIAATTTTSPPPPPPMTTTTVTSTDDTTATTLTTTPLMQGSVCATQPAAPPPLSSPLPSDEELAAHVQAHASPQLCRGRSLWFRAEDVLELHGRVDVNATPIEVCLPSSSNSSEAGAVDDDDDRGGDDVGASWCAYNVECLTNPEDGFRVVNSNVAVSQTPT